LSLANKQRKILYKEITDEDAIAVLNGNDVKVKLEINPSEVTEDDKTTIENGVGEQKIGKYIDITINKYITGIDGNTEKRNITSLSNEISITVDIPNDLKSDKRIFSMARLHNGEVTVLKDIDDNVDTLTFKTDSFSTYAILYADPTNSDSPKPTSPNTGDYENMGMLMFIMFISLGAVVLSFTSKKKFIRFK
jgi:hypothetical protein